MITFLQRLKSLLGALHQRIVDNADEQGYPYFTFGVFCIVTYPVFYLINQLNDPFFHDTWTIRLLITIAAIPLIFEQYIPLRLISLKPYMYYLCATLALPFLFTYILLINQLSFTAFTSSMIAIFLSLLLLDFIPLMICACIGILAGIALYFLGGGSAIIIDNKSVVFLSAYANALFFGSVFVQSKETIQRTRFTALKLMGGSIAHELRTPLASIRGAVVGLQKYLPRLIDTYERAQEAGLSGTTPIRKPFLKSLSGSGEKIFREVNNANTFIDMLLVQINRVQVSSSLPMSKYLISECIHLAVERYPFIESERHWIQIDIQGDYEVLANQTMLIHVLFCLIKNALFFVRGAAKPNPCIKIMTKQTERTNQLFFIDNGSGISADVLPNIFRSFYSKRKNGTGIGLAFCRSTIQLFGGNIDCKSIEGEFTEFILSFPQLKSDDSSAS